jgi:TolA-binding protein
MGMNVHGPTGVGCSSVLLLLAVLSGAPSLHAGQEPQAKPLAVDAALMLLDAARRAFNEGKCDFAAERFREFLAKHGGHPDAPAAHYGLALSLLELPQRDHNAVVGALQQAAGRQDFPDRPFVLYYLANAQRAAGRQAHDQAAAKPNEAQQLRNAAAQHFGEAAKNFAAAAEGFAARVKAAPAATAGSPSSAPAVPSDTEWLARSRCGQCDVLLRLEKFKEAAELAQSLLADKALEKSAFREQALYYQGYAAFGQRDYLAAGRALSQLAPFQQDFGPHARYLLSRTHHLAGERPEAAAGYKAVVAAHDEKKKAAAEAMKNPGALKPDDRAAFEALLKTPPEYVLRAAFYSALLAAEDGQFGPAMEGFNALAPQCPPGPLADEIRLRQGYCFLQVRNFPEALKVLQPLQNHPQLADRAMWWFARAQAGAADPNNAQAQEQALRAAAETLARAADRAGQLAANDPDAKTRRGDILLELGDTQQLAKLYREAAATYQKALAENASPDRAEEAMQRQATALHLAGQYKESDEVCRKFEQAYPKSTLLAAVWFRAAENACLAAVAASPLPLREGAGGGRRPEQDKLLDEAITRYRRVLGKYPDFAYANLARYGLATAQYHKGQLNEAITTLSAIAEADRLGELAPVSYLLADCHIRLLPTETDDAIQAAKLIDRAEQAAKLLIKYAGGLGKTPQAADVLLKFAHCQLRVGMLLADPAEKQKTLALARTTYERVMNEFGQTPAMPMAVLERARCIALMGDPNGAIGELNRFHGDPLRSSPVAPLAMIRQASLMRAQGRLPEALNLMTQCRSQHEAALQKDPERGAWLPLLQYEHALALKDTGKLAEARAMFEATAKQFSAAPEAANALWRAGQCRREELQAALAAARAVPYKPGVKPEEIAAATKATEQAVNELLQTAAFFAVEAGKLAPAKGGAVSETHLRMLYEAAWCQRALAEGEIEAARQKLQSAALAKVLENIKKNRPNQPLPALNPPDVALPVVPPPAGEKTAQAHYAAIVAAAPRREIAGRVRLELAEMHSQRGKHDEALDLLASALEEGPASELAERIHLRIATCLLAKGDVKNALARAQTVSKNAQSPFFAEARALEAEAHMRNKDWQNAIAILRQFRDHGPLQNVPAVTPLALLRLGQALAEAKAWDESRGSYEACVNRFNQSPWVCEARFGMGWAWQNMNQHDQACNMYAEVARGTAAEIGARAQLQLGLCRLAQKRFPEAAKELLVVPSTYDYPELSAAALCEAGQAHLEQKQPAEAAKLWQSVVKDYATSKWAATAKQRLAGIK